MWIFHEGVINKEYRRSNIPHLIPFVRMRANEMALFSVLSIGLAATPKLDAIKSGEDRMVEF